MSASFSNTLTLSDALKVSAPLNFNVIFKPLGPICNLNCSYCYYLDKINVIVGKTAISDELLEYSIKSYIESNDTESVTFNWHGGEPLLLGVGFLKKIVSIQNKYRKGKSIYNTLQTNGVLLNDEFAEFFSYYKFLIGVSIDGTKDVHDKYRKDVFSNPTFDRVLNGISLLQKHGVEFNTMTTINKANENKGLETYSFLKDIGSHYMQFMPVLEHINKKTNRITHPDDADSILAPWSVDPLSYGKFMTDIFDHWIKYDVGSYFVNLFDSTLANWCGVNPGTCSYSDVCGGNVVVEHNGDIYPCDHFVYPEYKLGNITEKSLKDIVLSYDMIKFGIDKRNALPDKCLKCNYLFACHGECPKHRFSVTESGEKGLNSLCDGFLHFYSHVEPYMNIMRDLLRNGKSPSEIMRMI